MTMRMDSLIGNRYQVQSFEQLPLTHQLAIVWHMAVDGDAWDGVELPVLTEDGMKAYLADKMPDYITLYGNTLLGVVDLSVSDLRQAVMQDVEIRESFSSWEAYHDSYIQCDTPRHPVSNRWPVILSDDDGETLYDGWHRFHSYQRDGAQVIPAVFFPHPHHLDIQKPQ